jgi:hypothetical protein
MSSTPSFKAIYLSQSILGDVAEARLEHFEYFENNPQQALIMRSFSKRNSHKIFHAIPVGREAEYVDIVKRAWSALQLPPEDGELKVFLNKFEVSGVQQVLPQRSYLNSNITMKKPGITATLIIFITVFFLVVLPVAGWLGDRTPLFGVAVVALYIMLVVRFLKRVNKVSVTNLEKVNSVNQPIASTQKLNQKSVDTSVDDRSTQKLEANNNQERLIPLEKREASYDRNEGRRSYRKN